jgi:hypothetical protein
MKKEELLQELQSFSVIELLELYVESRTGKHIDIYESPIEHLDNLEKLEFFIDDILNEIHYKKHTPT